MTSSSSNNVEPAQTVNIIEPVDQYTAFAVRGAIIGTGLLGLTFYVKNSRLFARYRHVKNIPKQYYQTEVLLKGVVREVTPTGLLKVEHQPIVSISRLFGKKPSKNTNLLNIRLAGLNISPEGVTHLTKDLRLTNRSVMFGVVKSGSSADTVDSVVNVKNKFFAQSNLNVDLVRKGMARVLGPDDEHHIEMLHTNPTYARLVTRLLTSERVADRRGIGIWERSTWVESFRSIPASFGQIIRAAAITKLLVLIFDVLRDLIFMAIAFLRQSYNLTITVTGYATGLYRSFAQCVDRVNNFYVQLKTNGLRKALSTSSNSQKK